MLWRSWPAVNGEKITFLAVVRQGGGGPGHQGRRPGPGTCPPCAAARAAASRIPLWAAAPNLLKVDDALASVDDFVSEKLS